jgi:hypothetical protein
MTEELFLLHAEMSFYDLYHEPSLEANHLNNQPLPLFSRMMF